MLNRGAIVEDKLATKRDLRELELRLAYQLTVRFDAMLAAVAIIAALNAFMK